MGTGQHKIMKNKGVVDGRGVVRETDKGEGTMGRGKVGQLVV